MEHCVVCGTTQAEPLYPGIVQCRKCGHLYAARSLPDGDLSRTYGDGYFFGGEYSDYLSDEAITRDNFGLRLERLRRFLDPARHRRLLEIGCAYGFFLDAARRYFGSAKGIDVSGTGTAYAREHLGLDAIDADFMRHDFSGARFDVVCLWDTIEHLADPGACLAKISGDMMEKGALVAITTGDAGSLNARIKKERWRLMQAPTHLHFFSRKTLRQLLEREGFEVLYDGYCGFYRSIGMALHRISLVNTKWGWLYDAARATGIAGLRFYLNLYDVMYIIARKK